MTEFRERSPWWGGDLQTVRNAVRRPRFAVDRVPVERLVLPVADGSDDVLVAALQRPAEPRCPGRPLVVLIHGLAGSEDSAYMRASASHFLAGGHPVLRLNLRGAGPARPLCRLQYHAGRSSDLCDALAALPPELATNGLLLVGYSLGGNMLLKFAAEHASELSVIAVASVSAPIDLAASCRRFMERRNRFYHWNMLRNMKHEALAAPLSHDERRRVLAARNLLEFDDRFVAPRNGYRGASHYYAENSARGFLFEIRVPALVIHARNDPWIPVEAYTSFPWRENEHLAPLLAESGGHVGFHARDDRTPWHDRCVARFFSAQSAAGGEPTVFRAGRVT